MEAINNQNFVNSPKPSLVKSSFSYWNTLISAKVEDANPDKVVLIYSKGFIALSTYYTIAGKTITEITLSADKKTHTLTVSAAFVYGDVCTVALKNFTAHTITNNVLYDMLLTSIGNGTSVSTLQMEASSNVTLTLDDNATFYSDSAGTLGASKAWIITPGALRTIYLRCPNGTALMKFSDISKIVHWGKGGVDGWIGDLNSMRISSMLTALINLQTIKLKAPAIITGLLPVNLKWLQFQHTEITWSYSYLPPVGLTAILLQGPLLNYPILDFSGITGNMTIFSLNDYRITKTTSAEMVTLLTSLKNKVGTLPSLITINDYADYASPPQTVINAVAALKLAKSITTVNLGL
jgi:hypothetical protein